MQLIREPLPARQEVILGIVGVLGLGAAGEALIRSGVVKAAGMPLPSAVLDQAWRLVGDSTFQSQVFYTLREWMLGLLIAAVIGVLIGGLMGAVPAVYTMFSSAVEILRPLPAIAIGPLLVLLLGAGMLPLALTVSVACLWPILLNAVYGVRAVDPVAIQTARTLHLSPAETFVRVRLPASLPFAFTGIRVAASIGLIVAVSAELLIGNGSGIGGYILLESTSASNLDAVYAATVVAGLLGVFVSVLFALFDKFAFGWKKGLSQ